MRELYPRGFPFLRVLSDAKVAAKAAERQAIKALEAIDPVFPVELPRAVATRYLRGYRFQPFKQHAQIVGAVKDDAPPDQALLAQVLEEKIAASQTLSYGGETYDFRLDDVTFTFEAFLGAETVTQMIVEHLIRAVEHPAWWGQFVDHRHTDVQRLAVSVGWLRLRMPAARWRTLVAPLRGKRHPELPSFSQRLQILADDNVVDDNVLSQRATAMQRRDRASLAALLPSTGLGDLTPQLFHVLGADALFDVPAARLAKLPGQPKWWQLRIIEEFGTLPAPGAIRVIAALLPSRSAGEAARAWLTQQAAEVDEALPVLAKRDPASAQAIRAARSGDKPAPPASKPQLRRELKALYAGLEQKLAAQGGKPAKERSVLDAAFARYCELNAALGEVIPEAYFTHGFEAVTPKWKCDQGTAERWIQLAVAAAGG